MLVRVLHPIETSSASYRIKSMEKLEQIGQAQEQLTQMQNSLKLQLQKLSIPM
jgi:hypothetical protein